MWLSLIAGVADRAALDTLPFLFSEDLFAKLLTEISKATRPNLSTEAMSQVLMALCERSSRLKIFVEKVDKKARTLGFMNTPQSALSKTKDQPRKNPFRDMPICDSDVEDILRIIQSLAGSPNPYAATTRAYMIGALRYIFRHAIAFEPQKNDPNFYLKLLALCRDHNKGVNTQSWKMFYNLVLYHTGVVDILDKNKILIQFFDIVGTTAHGNVVITNALHYITKVFQMYTAEQRRQTAGQELKREDIRATERDVKQFIVFFKDRHLFIKSHMIYKRFSETQPGAAFLELAKFYRTIETLPETKKLLIDIQKFPDYKIGLEKVTALFNGSWT
eukprot:TRINITY_DN3579_c0_g1_i1.p1 TRINITY_DN3579_c0_g1~~TRINITY_DN3579_c0_g1_i1.p1  ORF type:complete len:332 (+),score=82.77 TRINITY_DN3579_c0_g1_i1:55-1050(+)